MNTYHSLIQVQKLDKMATRNETLSISNLGQIFFYLNFQSFLFLFFYLSPFTQVVKLRRGRERIGNNNKYFSKILKARVRARVREREREREAWERISQRA